MKKTILIITILLTLLFVVSCNENIKVEQVDDSQVPSTEPAQDTNKNTVQKDNTNEQPAAREPLEIKAPLNNELQLIVEKATKNTNYQYFYSGRVRDEFRNFEDINDHDVYVKDNKVQKKFIAPVKFGDKTYYDKLFIDYETKEAYGICVTPLTIVCRELNKKYESFSFEKSKVKVDPRELSINIGSDAKKTGTSLINGRKNSVYEFERDGFTHRLSVDDFTGITMRFLVLSYDGDEEIIEEEHDFNKLATGNVLIKEVSVPSDYTLKE
jgi:hypothetical protein